MDVINLISKSDGLTNLPLDSPEDSAFPEMCANGPRVHEYLQEMNNEVLSSMCLKKSYRNFFPWLMNGQNYY